MRLALLPPLLLLCFALQGCGNAEFRNLDRLPIERFREAPLNFQGNTFVLDAQIDSQLAWEEGTGKLLSVRPTGENSRLPVFLPDSINQNMLPNQRYRMKVTVRRGGLLSIEAVDKY